MEKASTESLAAVVLVCDVDGLVTEVCRDEFGLTEGMAQGTPFSLLVDRGSLSKALNFILEVRQKGSAFDWELAVVGRGWAKVLTFAGVFSEGKILIVGTRTPEAIEELTYELAKMNSELVNELREAFKRRSQIAADKRQSERFLYDEMQRLNNEMANLQRNLFKKNVELERLNELKNRFLGMAAHDLRTPLGAIQIYSDFLLEEAQDSLTEEQLEFIAIIKSSSKFMLDLVNDLLDVSKISAGKLQLDLQRIDLADLVRRNCALAKVLAAKREVNLVLRDEVGALEVEADPSKLEQVLNNIIGNAIKFSDAGSEILVRLRRDGQSALISVSDQGPGIPKEELVAVFEPFKRSSVKLPAGEQSTGLGLAIVKSIVNGHHGKVWVESEVGKGATFYVSLPLHEGGEG